MNEKNETQNMNLENEIDIEEKSESNKSDEKESYWTPNMEVVKFVSRTRESGIETYIPNGNLTDDFEILVSNCTFSEMCDRVQKAIGNKYVLDKEVYRDVLEIKFADSKYLVAYNPKLIRRQLALRTLETLAIGEKISNIEQVTYCSNEDDINKSYFQIKHDNTITKIYSKLSEYNLYKENGEIFAEITDEDIESIVDVFAHID